MAEGTICNLQLPRTWSDGRILVPVIRPSGSEEVVAVVEAPELVTRNFLIRLQRPAQSWPGTCRLPADKRV